MRVLCLTVALSLFAGEDWPKRKKPTAIVELGAAGEWDFPGGKLGPTAAPAFTISLTHSRARGADDRGRRRRDASHGVARDSHPVSTTAVRGAFTISLTHSRARGADDRGRRRRDASHRVARDSHPVSTTAVRGRSGIRAFSAFERFGRHFEAMP